MKRTLLLILAAVLMLLTGCSNLNSTDDIGAFVEENADLIIETSVRGNYDAMLMMPEIDNIYNSMDCVVFTTGTSGLLTDTRCGFYYSFDGAPAGAGYANTWKLSEKDGVYSWSDSKGRIEYHTTHLFGNFYYFEGTW